MQLVRFTRWLKEAAKIKGIKINERKSGIERYVRLGDVKKVDDMDTTFFDS